MDQHFARVRQVITDLAPTHPERAKRLKVHPRMVMWYIDGTHIPTIRVIRRAGIPDLLEALILDLQDLHAKMLEVEISA